MADFAKTQLLKYGWTEGKGLGKYENGIVEALKPKLKFDTTGVGHDASEYNWWEFVYNKASNNLNIDTKAEGVKMNVKDRDAVEIKTSKSELNLVKIKKDNDLHYGSFIKTSTLENGKVTKDPDYMEDQYEKNKETSQPFMIDDVDLFKACGGRTAHKGARHGLKLNGKLARIERQEQELLVKMNESNNCAKDWICVESKRKKKKKNRLEKMDVEKLIDDNISENKIQSVIIPNVEIIPTDDYPSTQSKKTRRKAKRRLENLTQQLETSFNLCEDKTSVKDKKSSCEINKNDNSGDMGNKKKRKRKKKHCSIIDEKEIINDSDVECINEPSKKKSKKDILEPVVLNSKIEKRKRNKKCKKERKRIDNLSTSLMTLDLVDENQVNNIDNNSNK